MDGFLWWMLLGGKGKEGKEGEGRVALGTTLALVVCTSFIAFKDSLKKERK